MNSEDRYPFAEVEARWRKWWQENKTNHTDLDAEDSRNFYVLVMFCYPSSTKLHIGHWYNYGPVDTYARFKRLNGYKVFEPMGYDAFGLPAENFAIQVGRHPKEVTEDSISSIQDQLETIGAMYDWRYKVVTSRPDYYRWTQWLFLKLFEHDMAYQKEALVNWCPDCQTVLANEQVLADGTCERCGHNVYQRKMNQWFFRTTKYADELLEGLKEIDWPEGTVKRQQNWIGRSEGANICFPLKRDPERNIEVFTTRPDTIFGVTYLVLAPENELVEELTTDKKRGEVNRYVTEALKASEIDRTSATRKKTGVFTGSYALHPFTGDKLPIWIADYVLGSYGTGSVMAVPAHDQRDFEFAEKFKLPIKVVIRPSDGLIEEDEMLEAYEDHGIMINSGDFSGLKSDDGVRLVARKLKERDSGGPAITYRLRDWSISRQRYWGAPIPIVHCEKCGAVSIPEDRLPVLLPDKIKDFRPKGASPLGALKEWIATECPKCKGPAKRDPDTMDTFVDSAFYHLRYLAADREDKPFDLERLKRWMPINVYVGGIDHATGHLIYFRFITRFLNKIGLSPVAEPAKRLIHQGHITSGGVKMSKRKENVVNPDDFIDRYGSDVFRMYLMFMGDYREGGDWSDEGITGIDRFLNRIWRLVVHFSGGSFEEHSPEAGDYPDDLFRTLHRTIKSVADDLEAFSFNTAISRMMELVNGVYLWIGEEMSKAEPAAAKRLLRVLIIVLAPFAPHFAEEAWHRLGGDGTIFDHRWPEYDPKAMTTKSVTLVVQVNGKLRDRIEASADAGEEELKELAMSSSKVAPYLEKGTLRKTIVVPGKLVNLVVYFT